MNQKIGIIGLGIVGTAVYEGMKHACEIETYDNARDSSTESLSELFEKVDGPLFVCVPTPMRVNTDIRNQEGSCDVSIVENVISELNDIVGRTIGEPAEHAPIIIKSTIPPGTTERMNSLYKNVRVVFNPEFLTETNAIEDFKNQKRIIIGGPHGAATQVKRLYQAAYPTVPTTKTSSTIAEMVKYFTNCFLAVKVAFANEMNQLCNSLEIDYDKVIEYATQDTRLGSSHWAVPGPDGHFGFGGKCLAKDLNALIHKAQEIKVKPEVMKAAWNKNLEVRDHRDWETIKGATTNCR